MFNFQFGLFIRVIGTIILAGIPSNRKLTIFLYEQSYGSYHTSVCDRVRLPVSVAPWRCCDWPWPSPERDDLRAAGIGEPGCSIVRSTVWDRLRQFITVAPWRSIVADRVPPLHMMTPASVRNWRKMCQSTRQHLSATVHCALVRQESGEGQHRVHRAWWRVEGSTGSRSVG